MLLQEDALRYINAAARGRIQLTASSAHPELPYHFLSIITFCLNQVDLMFKLGEFFVLHGALALYWQQRGAHEADVESSHTAASSSQAAATAGVSS